MYSEFFKEVAGWETIETPEFFVTYQLATLGKVKSLKIVNAFVAKEFRNKGRAYEIIDLATETAKKEKCTHLTATVAKDAPDFIQQRTIHILKTRGMELMFEDDYNLVYGRSL